MARPRITRGTTKWPPYKKLQRYFYSPINQEWGSRTSKLPSGKIIVAGGDTIISGGDPSPCRVIDENGVNIVDNFGQALLPVARHFQAQIYSPTYGLYMFGGLLSGVTTASCIKMQKPGGAPYLETDIGTTGEWATFASLPSARAYHYACLIPDGSNRVLVGGGSTSAPADSTSMWIYNLALNTYTTVAALPAAVAGARMLVPLPSGKILAIKNDKAAVYDVVANSWTSYTLSTIPGPYYPVAGTLRDNGKVVYAGGFTLSNEIFEYDPNTNTSVLLSTPYNTAQPYAENLVQLNNGNVYSPSEQFGVLTPENIFEFYYKVPW